MNQLEIGSLANLQVPKELGMSENLASTSGVLSYLPCSAISQFMRL